MKIGMVCPYSLEVPGGVQAHALDLCRVLTERGHSVSLLAPAPPTMELPDYVQSAGKSIGIPYNGSVARLSFTPTAYAKLKKWLRTGEFEVLHLHEPNAPSISMLALKIAEGPIVATFHTSTDRSLWLTTFQGVLRPYHEKINGKIAVSELARRWQMEALGSDAIEIPNGVDVKFFADASPLPGYPRPGYTIAFLGRFDEPRKGIGVLIQALPAIVDKFPDLEVLVIGRGEAKALHVLAGPFAKHLKFLGQVDENVKAQALSSCDIYCAPNTGGESFGIVLVEAMAAGATVVASDLPAFRRVLADGERGCLFPVDDATELARKIVGLLSDPDQRAALQTAARAGVGRYDWSVVAEDVERVYETVRFPGKIVTVDD